MVFFLLNFWMNKQIFVARNLQLWPNFDLEFNKRADCGVPYFIIWKGKYVFFHFRNFPCMGGENFFSHRNAVSLWHVKFSETDRPSVQGHTSPDVQTALKLSILRRGHELLTNSGKTSVKLNLFCTNINHEPFIFKRALFDVTCPWEFFALQEYKP